MNYEPPSLSLVFDKAMDKLDYIVTKSVRVYVSLQVKQKVAEAIRKEADKYEVVNGIPVKKPINYAQKRRLNKWRSKS